MTSRARVLGTAARRGALAGMAGVPAMTVTAKMEQTVTGRPNSYVPARTLLTLLGRHPADDDKPLVWGHAMHWGTGVLLGALRGVWPAVGLPGPQAHLTYTVLRLSTDQTLENASGVGAPPRTWPREERVVDVLHKAVYGIVTGIVAERMISPDLESQRGRSSH